MKHVLIILLTLCVCHAALAQGLSGSPSSQRNAFDPPPLIAGKTDRERWDKFLAIQPSLIGMKFGAVEKVLGHGKTDAARSSLRYQLVESKQPKTSGTLATIELLVKFDKGSATGYHVEAVYWGGS
jgi:hypothetical protein